MNPGAVLEETFEKIKLGFYFPVDASQKITRINDNGGTRSGVDRRQYTTEDYTSERRSGKDRRSGADRRRSQNSRDEMAIERRDLFR
jgi:hypothetical protein